MSADSPRDGRPAPTTLRNILDGASALATPAMPAAAAANPDAELIAKATAFLEAEQAREKEACRFLDLPVPWSATDRREWQALDAESTGYHERLAEITRGEPRTPEGLVAQALVLLWHSQGDADPDAGKLAESVLRIHGVPLPVWAIAS